MPAENQVELVLVHSPLTGDLVWQPVAEVLRARGRTVSVPTLVGAFDGPGPYYPKLLDALIAQVAARPSDPKRAPLWPVVLAGHSGAGPLLPGLRARLTHGHSPPRTVAGTVYVDAQWPHPGRSWLEAAPPDLAGQLRELVEDGILPPWDRWLPERMLRDEVPDPELRERFRAGLPRLPLAYFQERAPHAAPDPDHARTAYLRLSPRHEGTAMRAEAIGHRVLRLTSHHLSPLTDPEATADALEKLARRFAVCPD
ncbi:hypothetical protein [Streptomyces spirodelae]|uniref:Alpha/beta hydrolase n=1 Tax=Streptomyces spirodelae TaxID=2812904 RepID=A0ABS3WQW2_9ACTN|nr:hypothetical protein [Streptomyces spirodelae]MBO8185501.1 hypothetical protein [Streptomyces spirodelae]